jgi:arylsulfatase A-like enzyme
MSVTFYVALVQQVGTAESTTAEQSSVVLILVDTLRSDYFAGFDSDGQHVAPLRELISDSIIFTRAYSHAPWTRPSVATLFTSLLPSSHGVIRGSKMEGGPDHLPDELLTLAEYLKREGYYTAGFVANPQLSPDFGFSQGYDEYYYADSSSDEKFIKWISKKLHLYYQNSFYENADSLNKRVLNFLDRNTQTPFFLYIHYMDPHRPYFCQPEAIWGRSESTYEDVMLKAKREEYLECYKREVEYVERSIAKLIKHMKASGMYEKSVIILTADHGEEFMEHGGWDHGHTLYEEQLRIPLLVKLPFIRNGQVDDRAVGLIDVFPTITEIVGLKTPEGLQGQALVSGSGERLRGSSEVFAERLPSGQGDRALISGRWKLIVARNGTDGVFRRELYNLDNDPDEKTNLSGVDIDVEERLNDRMNKIVEFTRLHSYKSGKVTISNKIRMRLKALGYLN